VQQLNESLLAGDLRDLVSNIFEVDNYQSKMGSDKDIVVLSFTVEQQDPAKDLVNFIERGYDFVLDADATPGELSDGRYKVFVEIERNRRIADQIIEVLNGVKQLTNIEGFRFRYHKDFHSQEATADALRETVPSDKGTYESKMTQESLNNFGNFFGRSYLESISVDNEDLIFQKKYAEPLRMRIKDFGPTNEVYQRTQGPIMLESNSIAEVMFLTKYIGNFNITKVGSNFIFENKNFAVVLEKI
jgi:hypothetical protein